MKMDKQKAGIVAAKYEIAAKQAYSKTLKERLLRHADVFRFIEASLGEKPSSLNGPGGNQKKISSNR